MVYCYECIQMPTQNKAILLSESANYHEWYMVEIPTGKKETSLKRVVWQGNKLLHYRMYLFYLRDGLFKNQGDRFRSEIKNLQEFWWGKFWTLLFKPETYKGIVQIIDRRFGDMKIKVNYIMKRSLVTLDLEMEVGASQWSGETILWNNRMEE